jgi:hypothetical protein
MKSSSVTSARFTSVRAKAIKHYQSYIEASKEHMGARCYGEDVTLLVDGEITKEHTGHLRLE